MRAHADGPGRTRCSSLQPPRGADGVEDELPLRILAGQATVLPPAHVERAAGGVADGGDGYTVGDAVEGCLDQGGAAGIRVVEGDWGGLVPAGPVVKVGGERGKDPWDPATE